MIINKKYFVFLAIVFLAYLLPELLSEDTMLYVAGGLTGALFNKFLEVFIKKPSDIIVFIAWGMLLLAFVIIYYRVQNKVLKYISIALIFILLYLVDFVRMKLIPITVVNGTTNYLAMTIDVLLKSLILSIIVFYGFTEKDREIGYKRNNKE